MSNSRVWEIGRGEFRRVIDEMEDLKKIATIKRILLTQLQLPTR